MSKFAYPIGNTHNVWRDRQYLFIGDEIFGCPQCINGPRGYVHVVDLTDIDHPVEVGKYEVPEAGAHNMWAEEGKLYIAYYNGGLGSWTSPGSSAAICTGRAGRSATSTPPMTRASFPMRRWPGGRSRSKAMCIVSDMNSGLWVVKLDEKGPLIP